MKRLIVVLCLLTTLVAPVILMAATTTQGGQKTGVKVREVFYKKQDKYDTATDLHFKLWQQEDNININGWEVTISEFTGSSSQRGSQPPPHNTQVKNLGGLPATSDPDNGQHGVDVTATGSVNRNTWVRIEAVFWLTNYNTKRLHGVQWTRSSKGEGSGIAVVDSAKACPDFGWTVGWPEYSGGSQFLHTITVKNDDSAESFVVKNFRFLATYDSIADLDTVGFDYFLADSVALAPESTWTHGFSTTGSLVGGHIYGHFTIQSPTKADDDAEETFDHPVVENPMPVHFHGFNATEEVGGVLVEWNIPGVDLNTAGFNLYRSTDNQDDYRLLNRDGLIAGENHITYLDRDVEPGRTYWYRVGSVDLHGVEALYGPVSVRVLGNVSKYELLWAYPNPTGGLASISFRLRAVGLVDLSIYDSRGRLVREVVKGNYSTGLHHVVWDGLDTGGREVSAGTYYYSLRIGDWEASKKLTVIR